MTLHLQNTITQSQYDHYIIIFSYTHIWVSSSYLPMHCFIRRCWRYGDDYASATFGFKRIRSIQITHNYTQHSRCVRCTTLQAVAMADSEMSLPILWSLGSLLALDLIVRSASVQNKPHSQIVWTKYTNSIILFLSLSFSLSITSSSISFFFALTAISSAAATTVADAADAVIASHLAFKLMRDGSSFASALFLRTTRPKIHSASSFLLSALSFFTQQIN